MSIGPCNPRDIPLQIARDWLANTSMIPGRIIAEFSCGQDARTFANVKGPCFIVTGGINHVFAVRELVPMPTLSQASPMVAV